MRKCGVAFARGLLTAAAFSTVSAQAQTPAEVKYPVRLANGFSVARESQAGREYCLVSGLRAMPAAGTESASVSVMTEIAFDTKGNSSGFSQIQIDAKETSFTNREEQPVKVRVELDGVAQDMPWGEVVNAVFTFLKFRFPAEYLNKVAAAKSMKVYTVDPTTKAAKLFATADVSGFAKAAEAHEKCTNSLSADFPTKLGQGWEITRETNSTCSLMMMGRYPYGIVRDGKGKAVLLFSEDDGEAMVEPIVFINDFPVETEYGGRVEGNTTFHMFGFAAEHLDRLTKDVRLEVRNDGEPQFGGANLYPPVGLLYLDKCVATLKAAKATAAK